MIQLHLAVFLFGLSGVFGKLFSLPATAIVLGRSAIAAATLFVFIFAKRSDSTFPYRTVIKLLPSGVLLAAHWFTFFYSIQISSVAIGLLSFAVFPVFVAFLDPFFTGKKIRLIDLLLAFLGTLGLSIIIPSYDVNNNIFQGVIWGLTSALTFALLTLFNRHLVQKTDSLVMGFSQNFWAAACLIFFYEPLITLDSYQFLLMLTLGIFCTALAHTLFISALKTVRPQLASISAGLEPVYGILMAFILLGETPSLRVLLGGLLIITVIVVASWMEFD